MSPPKVLPPHYFLLALLLMLAVAFVDSSVVFAARWHLVGLIPIGLGGALVLVAARQFAKADTNIVPLTKSTALVTHGVFSKTRNPMYAGMTTVLVGTALLLNGYLAWLLILAFVATIQLLFIRREEVLMEETFGENYLAYKSSVRRWL